MNARRRSTFYWAMRLLPRERREALFALYDIARAIDDVADGPGTVEARRAGLDEWRRQVAAIYEGTPTDPVALAFQPHARRFGLPRAELDALIDGQMMDLEPQRFDEALFVLYCRRVAGTVGLLALPIFGANGDGARTYALTLGEALQRVNVLRDIAEDAVRGRDYLPRTASQLRRQGGSEARRGARHAARTRPRRPAPGDRDGRALFHAVRAHHGGPPSRPDGQGLRRAARPVGQPVTDVHVVGGGLAGLSAALDLADGGARVKLYEAAPMLGGRCRSFHDPLLDREIDNGGHVVLSSNDAVFGYLDRIGARDEMAGVIPAAFPFLDLANGRTLVDPPERGTDPVVDHGAGAPRAGHERIGLCRGAAALFRRRGRPRRRPARSRGATLQGAVGTARHGRAEHRSARGRRASVGRDARTQLRAWRSRVPSLCRHQRPVARLRRSGCVRACACRRGDRARHAAGFNTRQCAAAVDELRFGETEIDCRRACVVLALPPHAVTRLLPDLALPAEMSPIVNAHYRLERPVELPGGGPILGLVGGTAQWLIARGDVVSVTVSAADALVERPPDALAALLWRDVAAALGLPALPVPPARTIKERRATLRLTPAQETRRPGPVTPALNLFLAGDWTQTGVPPTIEGAIRSGRRAARAILQGHPPDLGGN